MLSDIDPNGLFPCARPSPEGMRRYKAFKGHYFDGYQRHPCTCKPTCDTHCDGRKCGCPACYWSYLDFCGFGSQSSAKSAWRGGVTLVALARIKGVHRIHVL